MKKESAVELTVILIVVQCINLLILAAERIARDREVLGPIPLDIHRAIVVLAALAGLYLAFRTSTMEKRKIRLETVQELRREHNESLNETLRLVWQEFREQLRFISDLARFDKGDEIKEYVLGLLEDSACGEQETTIIKNPIITSLLIGVLTKARQAKVAVKCKIETDLAELHYDRATLIQIIGYILQYAINTIANGSSPSSHTLTIRIRQQKRYYAFLVLSTCSLFPPGQRALVFEKGFAAKDDDAGLGLYIARQAVLRMKGKIDARCFKHGETAYVVRLPIEAVV